MKLALYNGTKTVEIFDRIAEDYEKATGKKLDAAEAEIILTTNFVSKYVQNMSSEDLKNIIEKQAARYAYTPNIPITIYGNRQLMIPIVIAEIFGVYRGLRPKTIELMLEFSEYGDKYGEDNVKYMPDKELNDAVIELMKEIINSGIAAYDVRKILKEKNEL